MLGITRITDSGQNPPKFILLPWDGSSYKIQKRNKEGDYETVSEIGCCTVTNATQSFLNYCRNHKDD